MDALVLRREALAEFARLVVHVPVERLGEGEALRRRQSERMHVGDEHQQAGEALAALDDAEFSGLLDRVRRVAPRIRKADDLRLRRLRLQQERTEVLRV